MKRIRMRINRADLSKTPEAKSSTTERALTRRQLLTQTAVLIGAAAVAKAPSGRALAATPPAVSKREPVTIEYWVPDDRPGHKEAKLELFKDFETFTKGEIKISQTITTWDNQHQKVQAAFAAKRLPDVISVTDGFPFSYYKQGITQEITSLAKEIGLSDFYKNELDTTTYEGKILALPHFTVVHVLWYRKDWLDEKGVNPPKTWDEYREAAKALHDPARKRNGVLMWGSGDIAVSMALMAGRGAALITKDRKPGLNTPESIEVLEFLRSLFPYANPDLPSVMPGQSRLLFAGGAGAMLAQGSSTMQTIASAGMDKVDLFKAVPVPVKTGTRPVWTGMGDPNYLILTANAKPEAKEFFKFFYSKDPYFKYASGDAMGWLPVLKSTRENPKYYEVPRIKPFAAQLKACQAALERYVLSGFEYGPNFETGFVRSGDVPQKMVQKLYVEKNLTPKEVADWGQKEAERLIKENI
jgi:multiple sugar transport system substrate-binding protein